MDKGQPLILDPNAVSKDPADPPFVSPPDGAPVYYGFPVLPETNIDGWMLGEITSFIGDTYGDAFVVAPDGTRAGLVWDVDEGEFTQICEPSPGRWGVYAVWFKREMTCTEDILSNFKDILPQLKAEHARIIGHAG